MSEAGSAPAPDGDFIVDASWVVAYRDGAPYLLRDGSIRVREDRIVEVGEGPIRGNARRIDARGQLALPGFICGHSHITGGTCTRGIVEQGRGFMRPFEFAAWLEDDDDVDALTALNLSELLRSGCTTHVEMSLSQRHLESFVRVARQWGVRAYPGASMPGFDRLGSIWHKGDETLRNSGPGTLEDVEAYRRFALGVNLADDGRIRPMVAPHGPDTNTPETLSAALELARELGNGLQIHLARLVEEMETVERLWGHDSVDLLDELGFFSERVFAAHLSCMDLARDLPRLAEHPNFTFVHCPSGGGAGTIAGTQPYPDALAAGVNTSIGIDTHSNDFLENIKLAVITGRARCWLTRDTSQVPLKVPSAWDAVNSATVNAANGLGREDLGRIEPGAKADLCLVDVTGPLVGAGASPPEPLNNLLYANGLSVRTVITDGNIQLLDGELKIDDEARIRERGAAATEKIWEQLREDGWFDGTPEFPPRWPYSTSPAKD